MGERTACLLSMQRGKSLPIAVGQVCFLRLRQRQSVRQSGSSVAAHCSYQLAVQSPCGTLITRLIGSAAKVIRKMSQFKYVYTYISGVYIYFPLRKITIHVYFFIIFLIDFSFYICLFAVEK